MECGSLHAAALRRLGVTLEPDPEAARRLAEQAAARGFRVPAALEALYAVRGGEALRRLLACSDDFVSPAGLGEPVTWRWDQPRDLVSEGRLAFMFENQAVCLWALRLDGSADPPVEVARDPDLAWRPCTPTFSTFVEGRAFEVEEIWSGTEAGGGRILLEVQAGPLRPGDLAFLRLRFEEQVASQGWPGEAQWRFQRGTARLLIWTSDDQADWFIRDVSEAALAAVAEELRPCSDKWAFALSRQEAGERVLARARG